MQLLVGLENGMDGRPLAWALEYPGCYAYGEDSPGAVVNLAPAFLRYQAWVGRHTRSSWLSEIRDFDVRLTEVWEVYNINADYNPVSANEGYEVNAWFRHDWHTLTRLDTRRGLELLSFSRSDLLTLIKDLPAETLDREYPDERWSIRGVVRHIANAEHWYMSRLDLAGFERRELPEDIFARLDTVRARMNKVLPTLEGVEMVRGKGGEFWSPRKMLRRAVWHELDHIEHISKLLSMA